VEVDWDREKPEPTWGSALVLRNISNLVLQDFRGQAARPDGPLPAVVEEDVNDSAAHEVRPNHPLHPSLGYLCEHRRNQNRVVCRRAACGLDRLGGSSHAASSDSTNSLCLARAFSVEKLSEILMPRDQWHPFPILKDRAHRQALPKSVAAHLVARGEEALNTPLPPLRIRP
jgi:hypothetical protein